MKLQNTRINGSSIMMNISSLLSLFVLILSVSANASASSKLYKEYKFGMHKEEISGNSEVYDCSESMEAGALCLDEQRFAGVDVTIIFRFHEEKLVTVMLYSSFSQGNYITLMGALSSKFQLSTLDSGDSKLDLVIQRKKLEQASFVKAVTDFEARAIAKSDLKLTFIDKKSFNELLDSAVNSTEMMTVGDNTVRVVEYYIMEAEEDEVLGLIQFSAPKEYIRLIEKKAAQKYDDF